jgi:putative MATE family efflux protein
MDSEAIQLPEESIWKILKAAVKGDQKDFTTGNLRRALFMLAVPMVLEMSMEALFAVVDVFWVSRVGVDAVTTVGLTESVMMIIYAIAIGLSMAATAFVARRTGEKKPKEAAEAAIQALFLMILISLPLGLLGLFFARDILALMGANEVVLATGTTYARIEIGANIIVMLLFLNNGVFRGAGDASIAMRVLWLANILNMILGPIFIFGLGMGVTGAALATTLGRGIGVLYQFRTFFRPGSVIRLNEARFAPDKRTILEMFRVSLGGMGQFLLHSASWIFMVRLLSIFGSAAVAGYTIAIRVVIFTILPSWGLANAAATMVGQNLGAKQPDRAERAVWMAAGYNMIFLTTVSVFFFAFAPGIIGIFSKDPNVLANGVRCLRVICLGYVFFAYGMVIGQAFNGAGDTRTPTIMNAFCFWVFQIPLGYLLARTFGFGPTGVFIAQSSSFSLVAIVSIIIFRRGKWKEVQI